MENTVLETRMTDFFMVDHVVEKTGIEHIITSACQNRVSKIPQEGMANFPQARLEVI